MWVFSYCSMHEFDEDGMVKVNDTLYFTVLLLHCSGVGLCTVIWPACSDG